MRNFWLQTPSLQHVARVKIVTHLWSQREIFTQIAASFNGRSAAELNEYSEKWEEIEEKVESEASALPLPKTCKRELLNLVKPLGMEIIAWCHYHNIHNYSFKFLDNMLFLQLRWTMRGTVDYAKTAELMAKDERVDGERRFEIACLNCLEDEARQLIKLIPNDRIRKYIVEAVHNCPINYKEQHILVVYFICTLLGDEDLLIRLFRVLELLGDEWINLYLFVVVLCKGPRATCEYFFKTLSQREKDHIVGFRSQILSLRGTSSVALSPTCGLMYYLSLLSEEQQEEMLRENTRALLSCLLRWPLHSLFEKTSKYGWQLLDGSDCAEVLNDVIDKIRFDFEDYDYTQLFRELWRSSPAEYQRHYLNDVDGLICLFETEREEFIRLCLKRAPSHHLKEIVENRFDGIGYWLSDESVISEATLMGWKEAAALNSFKDPDDEEKRLRSQYVGRLVDRVMEDRFNFKLDMCGRDQQ